MKAVAGDRPNSTTVVALERKTALWRNAALGGSAVAATLAAFIVEKAPEKPTSPELFTDRPVPIE
jgi:hypothetical protein